jgi:anthranilate synthase component 1
MADIRDDGLVVSLPGERFTPFTAAKKLGAVAILESASFKKGRERYSIIQLDEAFRIRQKAEGVFWELHGKESPWPDSSVRGYS